MSTPPMGFNTWFIYTDLYNEDKIKLVADKLVSTGLRDLGYTYIQIDVGLCVAGSGYETRDANGNLKADPNRFPGGILPLAEYIHRNGLKVGYYTDLGVTGCGNEQGSYGHYRQDVNTFISWGADLIKVDSGGGHVDYESHAAAYRDFIDGIIDASPDRKIAFNICCGGGFGVESFGPELASDYYSKVGAPVFYRTNYDISASMPIVFWDDDTHSVIRTFDKTAEHPENSFPGGFNDMDALILEYNGLTPDENRAYFTLWCIQSSPLLLAVDLPNIKSETLEMISNKEVIAVDQDPLCKAATKTSETTEGLQVWSKIMQDENGKAVRCVTLFNRTDEKREIGVTWNELGMLDSCSVRDLWEKKDLGLFEKGFSCEVPSHGVVLLKVTGMSDGRTEAEDFSSSSLQSVKAEKCEESTLDVGNITKGCCLKYDKIDFGSGGTSLEVRAAAISDGVLELRIDSADGEIISECFISGTGGSQNWETYTSRINSIKGFHDVYITYRSDFEEPLKLNWFRVNHEGKTEEKSGYEIERRTVFHQDVLKTAVIVVLSLTSLAGIITVVWLYVVWSKKTDASLLKGEKN
ncbi:MAG: carbohydrate-binding protein [Clostridia bacterium]|nr:carbohydrate-binding protein [Clostridia bacterium]